MSDDLTEKIIGAAIEVCRGFMQVQKQIVHAT